MYYHCLCICIILNVPLFFTCPILLFPPVEHVVDLFRQSQYWLQMQDKIY